MIILLPKIISILDLVVIKIQLSNFGLVLKDIKFTAKLILT